MHRHPIEEVRGVRLLELPTIEDRSGWLTHAEVGSSEVPFAVNRCFLVHRVPTGEVRGDHAHRALQEVLTCVAGSVRVALDDGERKAEVVLNSPRLALYVPPVVWSVQYDYSPDAVLVVLASHHYDAGDYIRDYAEFKTLVSERGEGS
jgi:UDP-2-acetamido-3-amino-2,3-dideoxy-glucuronate N-acetyltransferase